MKYIEPLSVVILDGRAFKADRVRKQLFGGFCKCGGRMVQKAWVGESILISECEKCWRTEAFRFNGRRLVERREVEVVSKRNVKDFLSDVLTPTEFDAVMDRAKGRQYNYGAFSRARRKLENMGLNVEELLTLLA